jgi:putative oxygen-independent coproporphyrinogen III oxidase
MYAHGRDSASLSSAPILYFVVPPAFPRHVYVHVPFCARRCTYCDFSIAVRRVVPADEYVAALKRELELRFPDTSAAPVDTLYFGGGTPSRLGGEGVAALIGMLRERLRLVDGAEVTLETNPEDVNAEAIARWRDAGVNRLSLGGQSFDDRVLEWMHRSHDAAAIGRAVDTAREGGIENISLDLIFALPERVERSWTTDVARALELEPSHLSLYGLTIEPHTPMGRWQARGELTETTDERYESEFLYAHAALTAAGFDHYEVSNFGRPEFHSRHNSAYWSGSPYAGIGPSAHEFDGSVRRWNVAPYADWLRRLQDSVDPVADSEVLTNDNRVAEDVYLGLRTRRGITLDGPEIARLEAWFEAGWATTTGADRLQLTALGWLRLDALAADLTLVRSRY